MRVRRCSMNMPNRYFETGSAVCCVSTVTTIRSGTAGAGFCAAAASAHPKQIAGTPRNANFVFIEFLFPLLIQPVQLMLFLVRPSQALLLHPQFGLQNSGLRMEQITARHECTRTHRS